MERLGLKEMRAAQDPLASPDTLGLRVSPGQQVALAIPDTLDPLACKASKAHKAL